MGGVEGDDGRALHGAGWGQGDPHLQQRSGRHSKPYPGEALGRVAASRGGVVGWNGDEGVCSLVAHCIHVSSFDLKSLIKKLLN